MDYASAVDELFAQPHAQFVTERKRISGELRTAGKKLEAARLLAIQRPPISAWVVNQLWREARDAFDEMFATADRLRAGDLSASQAHRESIARLRARGATMLEEGGHNASEGTLRRVGVTLSALAATGGFAPEQPGCLADDRDPPGFEAIAAMGAITSMPSGGLPPGAVIKPIGGPALRQADESPIDHDAALRSLDDDGDDAEDAEAIAQAEQARKFEAARALVQKQRDMAAKAAASVAAAKAAQAAAAAAPVEEDEEAEDAETEEVEAPTLPANDKFAAAQALVQKQREIAAKAAATVAAMKAARAAPPKPVEEAADEAADEETEEAADEESEEETEAAPVLGAATDKFAAAQAMVQKQREMAAKGVASVAAAKAAREAAAQAPADDSKFAAAQAVVQKQREMAAKAAATVAAAKAAREGRAPEPVAAAEPAEELAEQLAEAAAHKAGKATKTVTPLERAQRSYDAAQAVPHRPSPPPAESREDQRKVAERERLRIEVKRARADLQARERAVDRLRTQLESAEIAVATAQATYAAYERKLRAIDPSYEPPDDPLEDDEADDADDA